MQERYNYLDIGRALAILGVVLIHSCLKCIDALPKDMRYFVDNGARGVQLFYIISGITIANSYFRDPKLKDFYINRLFRIAPLYYIVLIFCSLFGRVDFLSTSFATHVLFVNMFFPTMINSIIGVEWSIAIEMVFYLLVPLILRYITSINRALVALIVSIITANLGSELKSIFDSKNLLGYDYGVYSYFWLPAQLPFFLCGILFYFIFINKDPKPRPASSLAIMILSLMTVLAGTSENFGGSRVLSHVVSNKLYLWLVFFFGLLLFLRKHEKVFGRFLTPILIKIGKISFSVYLVHIFVIEQTSGWLAELTSHPIVYCALSFMLTVFFSTLIALGTYYLIEKPFIKVGKRLIRS